MLDRESAVLLWRYLELLIKQNGVRHRVCARLACVLVFICVCVSVSVCVCLSVCDKLDALCDSSTMTEIS